MHQARAPLRLNRISLRLAISGLALFGLIGITVMTVAATEIRKTRRDFMENRLLEQAHASSQNLSAIIQDLSRDVRFLAETPPILGIVRAQSDPNGFDHQGDSDLQSWLRRLESIFTAYARTHRQVSQARFIGLADGGRELVRIERGPQGLLSRRGPALQRKGQQAYFRQTMMRGPGEVFIGPISLNREHGEVSRPLSPSLRVATPVYDEERNSFGIVIINLAFDVDMRQLFKPQPGASRAYLLNENGDYLFHPETGKSFGFDLGTPHRWQDDFTSVHPMLAATDGQLHEYRNHQGELIYTVSQTLYPDLDDSSRHFRFIQAYPAHLVEAEVAASLRTAAVVLLPIGALLLGFLYLIRLVMHRGAQASLHQAELAAIVDSSSDAIISADLNGRIQSWNPAAQSMFGVRRAEALGQTMAAILALKNSVQHDADELRHIKAGQSVPAYDTVRRNRDGTEQHISVTASPIRSADDQIIGFAKILRDITAHKRAEARILKMNATLEQTVAERTAELLEAKTVADDANRAKSEFLANMSHEIRTPMNAVQGLLQLLERTELSDEQFDFVEKAQSAAASLLHIIDEILDYSKIEAGKLSLHCSPFSISNLLRDVAVVASGNVGEKPIELLFDIDPGIPDQLIGDEPRLRQILINLMGNAVKFTTMGEVILSLQQLEEDNDHIGLKFAVKDTGIGISAEQQARIFEAFVQAEAGTTRRFGGTGLGLVICRRLVDMMGGELAVDSTPGQGSCFHFSVTLQRETAKPASTAPPDAHPAALGKLRVLIVDDNAVARQIGMDLLHSMGWNADAASSGEDALKQLEARRKAGETYDLVLLDWRMPDMDGWEAARRIHTLCQKDTPILIMVSAYTREAYARFSAEKKALIDRMLMKPLTRSELFEAVASVRQPGSRRQRRGLDANNIRGQRLEGLCILVAEDNVTNQQVARALLMDEGAEVQVAANGQLAVDMLQATPQDFDLVLMDIQMPEMDGLSATRRIRQDLGLYDLPILAMTANAMPQDTADSTAAGMNGHVSKPFDFEQLVRAIQQHCRDAGSARPPTPPDADQAWPDTPPVEFDFELAIKRLAGKSHLFATQARLFAAQPPVDVDALGEALARGDFDRIRRDIHSLKGIAGTLGALALHDYCKAIEDGLEQTEIAERLPPMLDQLRGLLENACGALRQRAADIEGGEAAPAPATGTQKNPGPVLRKLEVLLTQSNMKAVELFAELRAMDPGYPQDIMDTLASSMAELDFPAALELVRALKKTDGKNA